MQRDVARRVAFVANGLLAEHFVDGDGFAARRQLLCTAAGPFLGAGGQINLARGVGKDDGALVAAVLHERNIAVLVQSRLPRRRVEWPPDERLQDHLVALPADSHLAAFEATVVGQAHGLITVVHEEFRDGRHASLPCAQCAGGSKSKV